MWGAEMPQPCDLSKNGSDLNVKPNIPHESKAEVNVKPNIPHESNAETESVDQKGNSEVNVGQKYHNHMTCLKWK